MGYEVGEQNAFPVKGLVFEYLIFKQVYVSMDTFVWDCDSINRRIYFRKSGWADYEQRFVFSGQTHHYSVKFVHDGNAPLTEELALSFVVKWHKGKFKTFKFS